MHNNLPAFTGNKFGPEAVGYHTENVNTPDYQYLPELQRRVEMQKFHQHYSTKETKQSEPIPGRDMVENSAGGYVFPVDDWVRLDRFLILGTEGGSYYATEQKLTVENAQAVARCIQEDGVRTVNRIVEVSEAGRAPKNDPALFALAMCCGASNSVTRTAALDVLPRVARIGTHLFHFLEYVQHFRGWGRGLRDAVGAWYNEKDLNRLAYQVVKYRQRDGWTHRDALRLSHPEPKDASRDALYYWVTTGELVGDYEGVGLIPAFELAQKAPHKNAIIGLIEEWNLTREMIPTEFLKEPDVWEALLEKMPMWAMIRNLATMTRVGLIAPLSDATRRVCNELRDEDRIRKARVHPIAVLAALRTYQSGHSARGKHSWQPVSQVVDALDDAFYLAFDNVESTGKRMVLALDVSGSMTWTDIAGIPSLTPRDGAAAMCMVTAKTESDYHIMAFAHELIPIEVSPRERLDDVIRKVSGLAAGGTDCALPMMWALGYNRERTSIWSSGQYVKKGPAVSADTFVVYTDNETWAGSIHPQQALQKYRRETEIPAKLVVVGMVSNGFSIADPQDAGMLDVVGFDTATPQLISDFVKE